MKNQKITGKSGVYAVLLDGVIRYIGSGSSLESRKSNHLARFRNGTHSKKLQAEFDRVGEDKFEFYVLDLCDRESLYILEDLHMKIHEDTILNKSVIRNTNKNIRTDAEQKAISKKFSEMMSGQNNPSAKITEKEAKEIIEMKKDKIKHDEIAKLFGISVGHVSKIGKSKWSHLAV